MILPNISEKELEAPFTVAQVKLKIFYHMSTRGCTCSATAFKLLHRHPIAGLYCMGLKKRYWEVWYFFQRIDKVQIDIEALNIASIGRIMNGLELK